VQGARDEAERNRVPDRRARYTRKGWEYMTDEEYTRIESARASRPVIVAPRRGARHCGPSGRGTASCD
jgi:hypothetical protein